jgi:hypothetical protein
MFATVLRVTRRDHSPPAAWSAWSKPERSTDLGASYKRARPGTYQDQPQAATLLNYCINPATDLRLIGENFAATRNQMDRAAAMFAQFHHRIRQVTPVASRPGARPGHAEYSPWSRSAMGVSKLCK